MSEFFKLKNFDCFVALVARCPLFVYVCVCAASGKVTFDSINLSTKITSLININSNYNVNLIFSYSGGQKCHDKLALHSFWENLGLRFDSSFSGSISAFSSIIGAIIGQHCRILYH